MAAPDGPRAQVAPSLYPRLIVGLGNPEARYSKTRHNLGFEVVERLAQRFAGRWSKKFAGELAQVEGQRLTPGSASGEAGGEKLVLLKPLTYMNRSGESVGPAARFFKVAPEQLLVVHDELDLPLGRVQLKVGGGHGGHNGLRSIEAALGSRDFGRVRVGIGRPPAGWDAADYVLSEFSADEAEAVQQATAAAVEALEAALAAGMKAAMNQHNRRP